MLERPASVAVRCPPVSFPAFDDPYPVEAVLHSLPRRGHPPCRRPALAGRRILVPESRALDLFASMLERQGAVAIRRPLVSIHDVEDAASVEAWLRRLAAGGHDNLVFFTGEGVTRLLGFAERAGIAAEVVAAMRAARKIVRGPKPIAALRRAGLAPDRSAEHTSELQSLMRISYAVFCLKKKPTEPRQR